MNARNRFKGRRVRAMRMLVLVTMLVSMLVVAPAASAQDPDPDVTTPMEFFGYNLGADYKLTPWQARELQGEGMRQGAVEYMQELASTSDRVQTFEYGQTEMGKPMMLMVITSPENWANMDTLKSNLETLADPRELSSDAAAEALVAQSKPVFWMVGTIHSTERTSSEVLLRLAYKLAAYQDAWTQDIVDNLIVVIEPSVNPDGLEMVTDWYYEYKDTQWVGTSPPYYNKYMSHDNNRDFLGLAQVESQNNVAMRFEWNPTVYLDLHETMTMLYMSPGPDPTNEAVNELTMAEWLGFAGHNISQMSAKGWRGVYTYDYADMWYPGYNHGFSFMHNTNGRFYELQGATYASPLTFTQAHIDNARPRTWYNPYPLEEPFVWHLMDAVNMEEDALKLDLQYTLDNRDELLYNFYLKGKRNMQRAAEAVAAYVIPADGGDNADVTDMLNNLMLHGIEIHQADEAFSAGGRDYAAGDYLVLMDQPYGLTAHNLMQIHTYPPIKTPYDVTTWSYGLMRDVETVPVTGTLPAFSHSMLTGPVSYTGAIEALGTAAMPSTWYLMEHGSNNNLAKALPRLFDEPTINVSQADSSFSVGDHSFPAGTFVLETSGLAADHTWLAELADELGLTVYAIPGEMVATALRKPRIGIYTTNMLNYFTMQEGWTRLRLDRSEFDYTRLYPSDVTTPTTPLATYDVIILPDVQTNYMVDGLPAWASSYAPPEYLKGMGETGVANLKAFVEGGGTLLCMGRTGEMPATYGWEIGAGLPAHVSAMAAEPTPVSLEPADFGARRPGELGAQATQQWASAPGSLLKVAVDATIPLGYGYDAEETVWVDGTSMYFVVTDTMATAAAWYPAEGDLLASGYLEDEAPFRGKAAMAEAPLGDGKVVLLGPNTVYRAQSTGTYMFFFNALIDAGKGATVYPVHLPITLREYLR